MRRRRTLLLALVAGMVAPVSTTAQAPGEQLESIVAERVASGRLHGGVLIADADEVRYEAAFGLADREAGTPNRPETLYPVHSITKSFTAILILQLVDDGIVALNGALSDYLAPLPSADWGAVTIHQLLSHRSGIPDYFFGSPPVYTGCDGRTLPTDELLRAVAERAMEFPPGEGFSYSNTGYVLLGRLIETLTDQPYDTVLRERMLDPLGMTQTRWVQTLEDPRITRQYMSEAGDEAPLWIVHPGPSGIVSTLDDMLRFARALGSPELLSPETWELAFTPHSLPAEADRPIPPHLFPHGYGFALSGTGEGEELGVLSGGSGCGGTALYFRRVNTGEVVLQWNNRGDVPPDLALLPEVLPLLRGPSPRP